jgi:hypothetical protein
MDMQEKKKEDPTPKPNHPLGITPLDTGFCFFSLLYPFRVNRDIYRYIFVFMDNKTGGTALNRVHYSELDGRYKAKIKESQSRQGIVFAVVLALLVLTFVFSFKLFVLLAIVCILQTGYEALDRRIRYLWLKREYWRKRSNAETESPVGTETD